jgi:beta-glucanase (GH16 family)
MTALSVLGMAGSSAPAHGAALPRTANAGLAATTAPQAVSPPKSYQLAFVSNFYGYTLNTGIWGTCYPWASPSGCTNSGNTSDPEQEWYRPGQIRVENGALALIAARLPTPGDDQSGRPKTYTCRSGMVTTSPSLNFQYGFVEIKARIPFGKGLWSAFWLAPANLSWPPEIDILEHWGTQTESRVFLHPVGLPEEEGTFQLPNANVGWHTFALNWTSARLTWYVDGKQAYTTTIGVPQQPMYLISNLAVDDATPGGCNGTLFIRYVKVWLPQQ